jgi:hypothetical protein
MASNKRSGHDDVTPRSFDGRMEKNRKWTDSRFYGIPFLVDEWWEAGLDCRCRATEAGLNNRVFTVNGFFGGLELSFEDVQSLSTIPIG